MTWMYLLFGFLGFAFLPKVSMEVFNDDAEINGDDQDNTTHCRAQRSMTRYGVAMAMTR
jgi:hypothetical protein